MEEAQTKNISAGNEPFTTTDQELALSLLTAGCGFASEQDGGPAQMHYTPQICRNRWITRKDQASGSAVRVPLMTHYPQSPEQFELRVMKAVEMKIPGEVTYFILRDSIFREAIAMHDKLADEAFKAEREGRKMDIPALAGLTDAQAVMVVCYIRRKNAKDMPDYGWVRSPNLAIGSVKKTITPKDGVPHGTLETMSYTEEGTGKIWSLNLSNEKRATIMSDGKPFIHPKPRA